MFKITIENTTKKEEEEKENGNGRDSAVGRQCKTNKKRFDCVTHTTEKWRKEARESIRHFECDFKRAKKEKEEEEEIQAEKMQSGLEWDPMGEMQLNNILGRKEVGRTKESSFLKIKSLKKEGNSNKKRVSAQMRSIDILRSQLPFMLLNIQKRRKKLRRKRNESNVLLYSSIVPSLGISKRA